MATAVTVDEESKSRLEELQAEIRLRTGKNVTQEPVRELHWTKFTSRLSSRNSHFRK